MRKFYPEKVQAHFESPKNVGSAFGANAIGTGASFVCGSFVRFSVRIEPVSKTIKDVGFLTNGCGFMIAAADVLSGYIKSKRLADLHGLSGAELKYEIISNLGEFSSTRIHCLETSIEAIHAAFADYRAAQIEEFRGETALICTCFGVSEDVIEKCIREQKLSTVEEVTDACSAGGGCGSCQILILEMLDSERS